VTRAGAHLLAVVAILVAISVRAHADGTEVIVITHPSRPISLTASDLRRIFRKQRRFWDDGSPVIAINQSAATSARARFESLVFGDEAAGLPTYWNRRYFEGVFPPITFDSDEAVQRYVASKPNAIGYVDTRVVNDSVHVAARLGGATP
jgi:ABC-type phosphate transport system substrate-binding protein